MKRKKRVEILTYFEIPKRSQNFDPWSWKGCPTNSNHHHSHGDDFLHNDCNSFFKKTFIIKKFLIKIMI